MTEVPMVHPKKLFFSHNTDFPVSTVLLKKNWALECVLRASLISGGVGVVGDGLGT